MKKILLLFLCVISFNTIHAEITWNLSDDGTLTISGTNMPNYSTGSTPWYSQRGAIKNVVIENGVTSIGSQAFSSCNSLTSITIPNSVTSIGYCAFYDCSGLTSITIPNSVTSIGIEAFEYCSSLTSVTIPNSVTSIRQQAFYGCSKLTSVTIPNSVTDIEKYAFSGCKGLTSITIPNSVTSIGEFAFKECSRLISITIPKSVTSIGEAAFNACSNLISIKVEEDNPKYDSRNNCNAIIESQYNTLHTGCKNTTIPNSVKNIGGYAFSGNISLTSITIPNSVTSIGEAAFANCSKLISITIPSSVTNIGGYAFTQCSSLTSVTIPNSVTSIGEYAFYNCSYLTSINCEAIIPPVCNRECFIYVNKSIPVYVPANSINAYKDADEWMNFTNIQPLNVDPNLTLALTDASPNLTEGYYKKDNVTYTRNNMSVGGYATFCLPFDIDLSQTTDNFAKVYVPLNISLCKPSGLLLLLLDEVNSNSTIKAGQPFVAKCRTANVTFKNSSDVSFEGTVSNPTSTNVKVYNFDGVSGALTQKSDVDVRIGGTFSKLTGLDDDYYRAFFTNGSFGPTTSVNSFRMYVYKNDYNSLGSKITSISFDFNDETTGIKELRVSNSELPVYDLNGRAVKGNNLKSRIYIINGKKYIK